MIYSDYSYLNLKYEFCMHNITAFTNDNSLVSSESIFKLPYTTTASGIETIALDMRFHFSGYKNLHWYIKLCILTYNRQFDLVTRSNKHDSLKILFCKRN